MRKITVGRLTHLFLSAVKPSLSPKTQRFYYYQLQKLRAVAAEKLVETITDTFMKTWVAAEFRHQSSSSRYNAERTVQRMMNWAVAEGLLERSPLKHYRKSTPDRRESTITSAQYAACLRAVAKLYLPHAGRPIRDAIKFLWHTGARPQEIRAIESRWVDGDTIKIPKELSKGKRRSRVIYLDSAAKAIVARLSKQYPDGPIFRNLSGGPWKKDRLTRAIKRVGVEAGLPDVCAYSFRHGHVTKLLERGVDIATVAAISGNSPRMITDWYSHVGDNHRRLLGIVAGGKA